jgi:hypothetical protein
VFPRHPGLVACCCAVFCLASLGAGIAVVKEGRLRTGQRNSGAMMVITAQADPTAFYGMVSPLFLISALCAVGVGLSIRDLRKAPKPGATRD